MRGRWLERSARYRQRRIGRPFSGAEFRVLAFRTSFFSASSFLPLSSCFTMSGWMGESDFRTSSMKEASSEASSSKEPSISSVFVGAAMLTGSVGLEGDYCDAGFWHTIAISRASVLRCVKWGETESPNFHCG
jgi:hypothetical protein